MRAAIHGTFPDPNDRFDLAIDGDDAIADGQVLYPNVALLGPDARARREAGNRLQRGAVDDVERAGLDRGAEDNRISPARSSAAATVGDCQCVAVADTNVRQRSAGDDDLVAR